MFEKFSLGNDWRFGLLFISPLCGYPREKPRKDSTAGGLRESVALLPRASSARLVVHQFTQPSKELQTNPSAAVRMQQQASLKKASTAITIEAF